MALARHIEIGKAYAGLLIDGDSDTPYVVATLTLTSETGLLVEVPYSTARDTVQFSAVERWFEARDLPGAFQFRGDELEMSLFGCRMAGRTRHFGRQLGVGRFIAQHAVLGLRGLAEPFDVQTVRSRVDGLQEWTGFTATEVEHDTDEHSIIHGVTIRVRSTSELSWRHGDATMLINTDWEGMEGTSGAHIDEWVTLSSLFDPPRSPDVHIEAQKAVRDLLVLIFGTPLSFRRHGLRDPSMPSPKYGASEPMHLPYRDLLIRETTWDHFRPDVEDRLLRRPIGWAGDYSTEALEAWSGVHQEWSRAVRPLVSMLNRDWFTVEDVVLGASISLEATGHLLDAVSGEEETYADAKKPKTATMTTYVLRALRALSVDWSSFDVTEVGIARLVSKTYNSIKHYDKPRIEDEDHVRLVADVSQIIARLAILAQLPGTHAIVAAYCDDYAFRRVITEFKDSGLAVTDNGDLVTL